MSMDSAVKALAVVNPTQGIPALVGKMTSDNIGDARAARRAQEKLEAQRRAQLAQEAADREAAKKRAETAGQRVGLGSARTMLVGTPGSGSGNTPFGNGGATLFGN